MPNRMIKESIRTSKSVNSMTDFQFRLWVYLITYVDDYGRGIADPEILKGFVFPRRKRVSESDIAKTLAELAGMGCINLYNVDGESYFYFPNWGDHQRIQTKKSKHPSPEEANQPYPTVGHGESPPETKPNQTNSISPYNPPQGECVDDIAEIVRYLNEKAGSNFRASTSSTRKLIGARLKDGFTVDDCKRVIDDRCKRWKGTEQEQYLRPDTLFRPSKFEGYLNAAPKDTTDDWRKGYNFYSSEAQV